MKSASAIFWAISILTLVSGCSQGPAAGLDPFGRTTIPPPATHAVQGTVVAPAQVDPYYSGPMSTAPKMVPVGPPSTTYNVSPATSSPTGYVTQAVEQSGWRKSDAGPATGRLQPISSAFLPSDSLHGVSPASAEPTASNSVIRAEYREPTNGLHWQQPGTSTAAPAPVVMLDRRPRLELSSLPRSSAGGRLVYTPAAGPSQSAARVSNYGYSHDYRWLKGQLEYSAAQRQWKLRYIPIDGQTDQYGGSVVLETVPELSAFRSGDFIQVQGDVRGQDRASTPYAAAYRMSRLTKLE